MSQTVLLGRDSNRDPDCYRANSIHHSNNDNSYNNVDDLTDLGHGSIYLYLYLSIYLSIYLSVFRDGSRRWQFQNKFIPVSNVLSTTTYGLYECIASAGSTYVNDHSSNVDYLITCNKFKLQYVGEASQNLNKRFNWHNSCFRNTTIYSFCKVLNTDSSKGYFKDCSYTANIIEKLEVAGRTAKPIRRATDLLDAWITNNSSI